mgnify:CR=1 FL=1
MLVMDIVREELPGVDPEALEYILWNHTGYPSFWAIPKDGNTPEECLRTQLRQYKNGECRCFECSGNEGGMVPDTEPAP